MRKIMLIDLGLCHDCNNCFMACKDEHCENETLPVQQPKHGHRWMNILRRERGQYPMIDMAFLPMPCQQCDNPECMKGTKGIEKRPDGIVTVDSTLSKGERGAVSACPYGAMYYNEEADCPQKCDFCLHLLESGAELPRCVEACPTGALAFRSVSDEEYDGLLKNGWQVFGPGERPSVLYRNLERYTKHFIGGSVIKDDDCLEGAKVTLEQEGKVLCSATTNGFGDFRFDALDAGSYTVRITFGDEKKTLSVNIDDAKSLGVIRL